METGHHHHHHHHQVLNGTMFSDLDSELTCNFVSASRKNRKITTRSDDDQILHHLNPQRQQINVSSHNYYDCFPSTRITKLPKVEVSTVCVQKSVEENRLNQSGGASTSGRRSRRKRRRCNDVDDAVLLVSPQQVPLPQLQYSSQQHLMMNSYYYLLYQNLDDEIDALIRLQHETLRSVVEQTQQRQCRLLLSVLEQKFLKRIKVKQIELENAWHRNAELQEKVKRMSAENQMWFNVARNNENMVLSLRSTLDQHQLLNQNHHQKTSRMRGLGGGEGAKVEEVVEEGFGDSSDAVLLAPDDAQSANINNNVDCHDQLLQENVGDREYKIVTSNVDVGDDNRDVDHHHHYDASMKQQQHRKVCKVCKEKEVSVLLLPCRHLCLCKDCEAKLETCPICNSFKNASLQIFMS